jgi:serine/threonine protein phosphatase PrpC
MPILKIAYKTVSEPLTINKKDNINENKDNYLIQKKNTVLFLNSQNKVTRQLSKHVTRLAVFDGVNSLPHSRELTEIACKTISEWAQHNKPSEFVTNIKRLHNTLLQQFANTAASAMTLLEFTNETEVLLNHIGDTRLYEISPNQCRCLTIDASPYNQQLIANLTDKQHVNQQDSNKLLHALGTGNRYNDKIRNGTAFNELLYLTESTLPTKLHSLADCRTLTLKREHYYLLCSDGFTAPGQKFIEQWPAICHQGNDLVGKKLDKLFRLLEQILSASKAEYADNATAILFKTSK